MNKNIITNIFLFVTKDYRTITSGWQGAPHFRRYGRELFKTGDTVKEKYKLGRATVERLSTTRTPSPTP